MAVERFIPSKKTKTKYSVPWINPGGGGGGGYYDIFIHPRRGSFFGVQNFEF